MWSAISLNQQNSVGVLKKKGSQTMQISYWSSWSASVQKYSEQRSCEHQRQWQYIRKWHLKGPTAIRVCSTQSCEGHLMIPGKTLPLHYVASQRLHNSTRDLSVIAKQTARQGVLLNLQPTDLLLWRATSVHGSPTRLTLNYKLIYLTASRKGNTTD